MRIAAVRLFVDDIVAARPFCASLLGLAPTSDGPSMPLFEVGATLTVERADAEAKAEGLVGRFAGVSFETADVEALHRRLGASGCSIVGAPERQPWGGRLMHVKDPSGNIVTLVQSN